MTRYLNAKSGRPRQQHPVPPPPPRKEDRPCCAATRDAHGRYCIGFCGPDCEGRPDVWAYLMRRVEARAR